MDSTGCTTNGGGGRGRSTAAAAAVVVGWAAERKRCGSTERKPGPEASRVNGRLADCMPQTRIDKNDR